MNFLSCLPFCGNTKQLETGQIAPHPTSLILTKTLEFFFCSVTFSETIVKPQNNYFHWDNFPALLCVLAQRIQTKPCLLFPHFRNQSKFSPKNPRGKGGRGKVKEKKPIHWAQLKLAKKALFTLDIIILIKRAKQYIHNDR